MKNNILIYLLLAMLFLPGLVHAQKFDLGRINGADYMICIPDNWNGGLVMYAHGYEAVGEDLPGFEKEVTDFMKIFTERGFAYAAAGYKRQGLVIKDGIEDTEALRSYFERKYGKPDTSIVTGHSMGGMISIATIEKYPAEYDGALPLCGWLAPVHSLMKYSLNMLATYDCLFGDNTGKIVTGEEMVEEKTIQRKLDQKSHLAALHAEHFGLPPGQLAQSIAFYQYVTKETAQWAGGLPAGNQETIYSGFGFRDDSLNKSIKRYSADPEAEEYFIEYCTPTGEISDPVVAMHTTSDWILPAKSYKYYEQMTHIKGTDHLYKQIYVSEDGHCNFTLQQTARAFEKLLDSIDKNKDPIQD